MSIDAARVLSLQEVPRLATERERPNDELVAQIEAAMVTAKIPPVHWIGNDPLPPVRLPQSPYRRMTVRLSFEDMTLRQLVQFAYHLTDADQALSIPELRLSAGRDGEPHAWNVNMSLSYLVYAPWQMEGEIP